MINSKELLINMGRTPDENSQEFSAFGRMKEINVKTVLQ